MLHSSDATLLEVLKLYFEPQLKWMDLCLLEFKTDGKAKGESFRVHASSISKLCPVRALKLKIPHLLKRRKLKGISPVVFNWIEKKVALSLQQQENVLFNKFIS